MNSSHNYDWLILVPTPVELDLLKRTNSNLFNTPDTVVELCGFGPIVAAAKSVEWIRVHRPQNVLLLGIAGSYHQNLTIGKAYSFQKVACFGVGVGFGSAFQAASEAGWTQWPGEGNGDQILDILELKTGIPSHSEGTLVTVTSAAASRQDVAQRMAMFEDAVAEDMEGFAVAVACKLANKPLTIVRGISNLAGDRDKANWRIDQAIVTATQLAEKITSRQV